jgi:hypothetical protein
MDLVQLGLLRFIERDDQLSALLVGELVLAAELLQQDCAPPAELRL